MRVIQLTDTHLFASPETTLKGWNTEDSLVRVLQAIRSRERRIDALLMTGDASEDGSPESYRRLREHLGAFDCPQLWIAGNHDAPPTMWGIVGRSPAIARESLGLGSWEVIRVDTHVAGESWGLVSAAELERLLSRIAASPAEHLIVAMHHPPVPVRAKWFQRHALRDPEHFLACLRAAGRVRAVIGGHVHQAIDIVRGGIRCLTAPSTCMQFHPTADDFTRDEQPPGYRWLELRDGGVFETAVCRVPAVRSGAQSL